MRYSPKHASEQSSTRGVNGRRVVGVAVASAAATTGVGLASAGEAHASTPANVWDRVAACESGGNWSISTGNGYYGGLQFSSGTWRAYGGTAYASTANRASRDTQIRIAQRVLANQGPGAWPVCSRRAGLTRSNGLAVQVGGGGTTSRGGSTSTVGKLAVDGSFGPKTTRAVQKWVGVTQDGSFGPISKRALQRKVGVTPDGSIGPRTVAALQSRIGISRDGASYLNARTVAGLQRYLNAHVL
ncbi:transglycosylase family protein [Luteipulveratus flavus]|uniref:Transglycosylase family protein n=1 Tax=Luteipulveratus flavus TaxID=3031728 RepID=A0ABT6CBT1_9MICO|nr:transglycosylase family protein [Luteipulveratus sp. YIM 133296]MDF8266358.1 transglycosylase family protein [Luteipulveratus sp. YIM 133296]